MRPEILALRAANQYRARDIIPYLGLRYYFLNKCSKRNQWANDVSVHLLKTRKQPAYFLSSHFKDFDDKGEVLSREIFLPGPNEAYAEAALLAECSKYKAFLLPDCVFSYRLASRRDTRGVYAQYFEGFRERHVKIGTACKDHPEAVVLYTDVKTFYPSISADIAMSAWNDTCKKTNLSPYWQELGSKILSDHAQISTQKKQGKGLLTGPMFSHLIANLVLLSIDTKMIELFPGRYFRYVDDVILVGTSEEVAVGRGTLAALLKELDLHLHEPDQGKDFLVSAKEWLEGANDFSNENGKDWAYFVTSLKQFLDTQPEDSNISSDFTAADLRIPIPLYKIEIKETPSRIRMQARLQRFKWLPKIIKGLSVQELINNAYKLRDRYADLLRMIFAQGIAESGYGRKRAIPRVRFLAGRLLYLGSEEMLLEFSLALGEHPELRLLSAVMHTVATRDVTNILPMGSNVVQSAAQLLRLSDRAVQCNVKNWTPICLQGLAIFRINGVTVDGPAADPLNRFATWPNCSSELMESTEDLFLQELACLHGVAESGRHAEILNSVFDWKEILAFDAINQVRESSY